MKPLVITGIFLVLIGILTLVYQGFTYTKQEDVAQIGNIRILQEEHRAVIFSPALAGLSLIVGLALIFIGRKK